MISQLATVAIMASVWVSPATVPPKFSIRSNSRSRLLASDSLSLSSWALATSGSRSVRRIRWTPVAADAEELAVGGRRLLDLEPRIGIGDPRLGQDLDELGRDDLGRRLRAVECRRVEVEIVFAAARETRRAASPRLCRRRRAAVPRSACRRWTSSRRAPGVGPNASRISCLDVLGLCRRSCGC